jgi:hypothetical protein
MKIMDFFKRGKTATPKPTSQPLDDELSDWSIVKVYTESTGQKAVFRARWTRPNRPDIDEMQTAIVIKWAYEPNDQMPPKQVNQEQLAFEEALDPLAPSEHSELVHVSTGMGLKEWIFYARSREVFMFEFNALLSGHPQYPLEIEFYNDPEWLVWADMVKPLIREN